MSRQDHVIINTDGVELPGSQPIMPFYFVFDESASMASAMPVLNAQLQQLRDEVKRNAQLKDLAHVCVMTFSDSAHCRMDMQPVSTSMPVPTLAPKTSTSYRAAFDLLADAIPADVASIKRQAAEQGIAGQTVLRPVVFWLSDGLPNSGEDWRSARARLMALREAPNIAVFGFGQVDAATIREVASEKCGFIAEQGIDPVVVLQEFFTAIVGSIISSALSTPSGRPQLQIERPRHALQLDAPPV